MKAERGVEFVKRVEARGRRYVGGRHSSRALRTDPGFGETPSKQSRATFAEASLN